MKDSMQTRPRTLPRGCSHVVDHWRVIFGWVCLVFCVVARAQEAVPSWAYPINPPASGAAVRDSLKSLHITGSRVSFTQAQLTDFFFAPDWYPALHSPPPAIVSRGHAPGVFACGYCHSPTGQGRPENAALAGLSADYIVQQVTDFKSGARRSAFHGVFLPTDLMIKVSANTAAEDVAAAAQYFAAQTLLPRVKVLERARVPLTHVEGWVYVAGAGVSQEPLAGRILELAPDIDRHERRDDHLRYIAYVPMGSVARGRVLSANGTAAAPVGCVSCHGENLLGAGLAPPIAGRSPTYLLRQLLALQTGARAGAAAALMKTLVASLSLEDMVAAAAYAASLPTNAGTL
jgi:cytochrome c553